MQALSSQMQCLSVAFVGQLPSLHFRYFGTIGIRVTESSPCRFSRRKGHASCTEIVFSSSSDACFASLFRPVCLWDVSFARTTTRLLFRLCTSHVHLFLPILPSPTTPSYPRPHVRPWTPVRHARTSACVPGVRPSSVGSLLRFPPRFVPNPSHFFHPFFHFFFSSVFSFRFESGTRKGKAVPHTKQKRTRWPRHRSK